MFPNELLLIINGNYHLFKHSMNFPDELISEIASFLIGVDFAKDIQINRIYTKYLESIDDDRYQIHYIVNGCTYKIEKLEIHFNSIIFELHKIRIYFGIGDPIVIVDTEEEEFFFDMNKDKFYDFYDENEDECSIYDQENIKKFIKTKYEWLQKELPFIQSVCSRMNSWQKSQVI